MGKLAVLCIPPIFSPNHIPYRQSLYTYDHRKSPTPFEPAYPFRELLIQSTRLLFLAVQRPAYAWWLSLQALRPTAYPLASASSSDMATVVASHHVEFWRQRRESSIHVPNLHLANMIPPYDVPRAMTNAPVSRSYQPTTTHMHINMPIFSANDLTTSVPYQSGAFAFDPIPTNPYNIQQATYYAPGTAHTVSYSTVPEMKSFPTTKDTRTSFPMDRSTMVKSESASPLPPTSVFNGHSYATGFERSASEQTDGSATSFTTDIDTLMRAIQARKTTTPPLQEPKV